MKTWPHAPSKCVTDPGTYIVTAATYHKENLFVGHERLCLLHDRLLDAFEEFDWNPMAWAVFPNHYHFVAISPNSTNSVRQITKKLHAISAIELNKLDGTPGRTVWYRCWDTRITFEKSLLSRIAYVHGNAVKHGIVTEPVSYPYCSANWFLSKGDRSFVESVLSFKTDKVNVYDDF